MMTPRRLQAGLATGKSCFFMESDMISPFEAQRRSDKDRRDSSRCSRSGLAIATFFLRKTCKIHTPKRMNQNPVIQASRLSRIPAKSSTQIIAETYSKPIPVH